MANLAIPNVIWLIQTTKFYILAKINGSGLFLCQPLRNKHKRKNNLITLPYFNTEIKG